MSRGAIARIVFTAALVLGLLAAVVAGSRPAAAAIAGPAPCAAPT